MMNKKVLKSLFLAAACVSLSEVSAIDSKWPSPPPQDQGLPYTRSSQAAALDVLSECIGVYAGGRYGWVYGKKVRVDDACLMRGGEPVIHQGVLYAPKSFAALLGVSKDQVKSDVAPEYLKNRWVYTVVRPALEVPSGVRTHDVDGETYVALVDLAKKKGLNVYWNKRGLFLASPSRIDLAEPESFADSADKVKVDNIITNFDTPELYMEPDLATEYIPLLKRQGKWTDHAKVSPEEIKLLDGPETEWPAFDRSTYDFSGFNAAALGGDVPAPGVYPRLLFSEKDLPAIRERVARNKIAQKSLIETEVLLSNSWLKPGTDDARIFDKLAAGDFSGLEWDPWKGGRRIPQFPGLFEGQKPGIATSHVSYNSQCLVSIAFYALLKDDDALGRKAAQALVNLYRLQEPMIDTYLEFSDSELGSNPADATGSTTQWRGMHGVVAHMDLPFALDFGGKWMTEDEKQDMYRIIAKATYGRRNNGGDGPRRAWRDINHVTWHMTHFLAMAAIEGQAGFDKEAYASGAELVEDFLQWGVDKYGMMYESNGKSGGGIQFQTLCMITLARRGNNMWGHPHWRKLMEGQVLNTAPNGATTVSSGTWSGDSLAAPTTMIYHTFYPDNKYAEFILSNNFGDTIMKGGSYGTDIAGFDLKKYRQELENNPGRTRLPSVNYPGFTMSILYDTDWTHTTRSDLKDAPLNYIDPEYGILSAYSENSDQAVWMNMFVRGNHYLGAGHHHADAGMFHFAADGVNWITESPFPKTYEGKYHNQVLINGISQPDGIQGRADWLGAQFNDYAAFASADLTQAYTWRWSSQFILFDTDDWGPRPDQYEWTLSKDPYPINAYKGTQKYKMRPWWPTGVMSNWFPVIQHPFNPVEYAYRSAGLIRGANPYGLVVDDVKKDDGVHLYQWSAMAGRGVWASRFDQELAPNMLVLAQKGNDSHHAGVPKYRPRKGDPMLLVCLLGGQGTPDTFETDAGKRAKFALDPYGQQAAQDPAEVAAPLKIESVEGPVQNTEAVQFFYDRIVGGCYSTEVHFRTLLIPFKMGEKIPEITYQNNTATIKWEDQLDVIRFTTGAGARTRFSIVRNGQEVFEQ